MELTFTPTSPVQAGEYCFDVSQARQGGSAGAVTLILQTILLPLALAEGKSTVILKGGTHVPWSPPVTYIQQVFLPILQQLGVSAEIQLKSWGWYPRGGGEVELRVTGTGKPLGNLNLLERGKLLQVRGLAAATELPSHIPQRLASRAENLLREQDFKVQVQPVRERGIGPGAGLFLTAEYEFSRAGFSALGRPGLAAEKVAEMAVQELLAFHATGAPVDHFLGDQLLLPLVFSSQPSQYRVQEITQHLTTNVWVISQFGLAEIDLDGDNQTIKVIPNVPH
jgi:RNA 3'-terminal phosphate cyclase (ATP)